MQIRKVFNLSAIVVAFAGAAVCHASSVPISSTAPKGSAIAADWLASSLAGGSKAQDPVAFLVQTGASATSVKAHAVGGTITNSSVESKLIGVLSSLVGTVNSSGGTLGSLGGLGAGFGGNALLRTPESPLFLQDLTEIPNDQGARDDMADTHPPAPLDLVPLPSASLLGLSGLVLAAGRRRRGV